MAPVWTAKGLQIGEGAIDWVHFFRVIGDYHGTMIPEIWRGHQRQGEGFLIAIQRLSRGLFHRPEADQRKRLERLPQTRLNNSLATQADAPRSAELAEPAGASLRLADQVRHARSRRAAAQQPVVFFNASTRITGLSQNAAFSLLTSWGLRLAGVPVVHFVCQRGHEPLRAGHEPRRTTTPRRPARPACAQSERLYAGAEVHWFAYQPDPAPGSSAWSGLSVEELSSFRIPDAT